MMRTTTSVLLAFSLLGLTALIAPPAAAHVCVFDYSESCAAPCGATGTHIHWGPRTVPCVSTDLIKVGFGFNALP
jgi:hypothetical protein